MSTNIQPLSASQPGTHEGALLGTSAVLVWNDVAAQGRQQFYQWHDKEHLPERLGIPGFRRGRRYVRPGHSPEWLTLYEADSLNVMVSPEYLQRLNAPSPATVKTLQYFQNTSRAVCQVVHSVGSSSGGHVLAIRIDAPDGRSTAMCNYLTTDVFTNALAQTGVIACHLYSADQSASYLNTAESNTRDFDVPPWVLLVEATTADAAEQARTLIDEQKLQQMDAAVRKDGAVYALEICRLATTAATAALTRSIDSLS